MSILNGIYEAVATFRRETGLQLPEIALKPNDFRTLVSEMNGKMNLAPMPLGLLPTKVTVDGCEVWPL